MPVNREITNFEYADNADDNISSYLVKNGSQFLSCYLLIEDWLHKLQIIHPGEYNAAVKRKSITTIGCYDMIAMGCYDVIAVGCYDVIAMVAMG